MEDNLNHWECHKCGSGNKIKNKSDWNNKVPEKCKNNQHCKHKRCKKCYNIDEDNVRVEYCDGRTYRQNDNDDPDFEPPVVN